MGNDDDDDDDDFARERLHGGALETLNCEMNNWIDPKCNMQWQRIDSVQNAVLMNSEKEKPREINIEIVCVHGVYTVQVYSVQLL